MFWPRKKLMVTATNSVCASCGTARDKGVVACPNCRAVYSDAEKERETGLSEAESRIARVVYRRVLRTIWAPIGGLVFVVSALFGWGILEAQEKLQSALYAQLASKFEEPQIRQTLEEVAKTRASELLESEVRPELADFRKSLQEARALAEVDIATLKRQSDLYAAMTRAEGEDRVAFDQLRAWADDPSYPDRETAARAWMSILDKHASSMFQGGFSKNWPPGIDGAHVGQSEILEIYKKQPENARRWVIESISERKDLSKADRMQLLLSIAQQDPNLLNVEYAGRAFCNEGALSWKPLAIREMTEWWAGPGGSAVRKAPAP